MVHSLLLNCWFVSQLFCYINTTFKIWFIIFKLSYHLFLSCKIPLFSYQSLILTTRYWTMFIWRYLIINFQTTIAVTTFIIIYEHLFQDISSAAPEKSPLSLSSLTIYKLSWITAAVKWPMTIAMQDRPLANSEIHFLVIYQSC